MKKRELLNIAYGMSCFKKEEKFYQFAKKYLLLNDENGVNDFFEIIKKFSASPNAEETHNALGVTGKGNPYDISAWCNAILKNSALKQLNRNELAYIMGYCARIAKIKEIEK